MKSRRITQTLCGIAAGGLLITASPSFAGDEFEKGFKLELGRIAAHHSVAIGQQLLAVALFGPVEHRPVRYGRQPLYDLRAQRLARLRAEEAARRAAERADFRKHEKRVHKRQQRLARIQYQHQHRKHDDCDHGNAKRHRR